MLLCSLSGISSSSCHCHFPLLCPWQMDLPTDFPEAALKARKFAVDAHGKSTKPKDPRQILNYDATQHYVWKGIADNSSRNKWMLLDSEYVNKQPKE